MRRSLKSLSQLMLVFAGVGALFAWFAQPKVGDEGVVWFWRVSLSLLAVLSLGLLVRASVRKDHVPDFLGELVGKYFERAGFGFGIVPITSGQYLFLCIFYQNRFARLCRAQVVLRPSRGFFLNRPKLDAVSISIECEGGAFGGVYVPWAVAREYQDKTQTIDVAANTAYPQRRGRLLRFRDGLQVGKVRQQAWSTAVTIGAAFSGMLYLSRPARFELELPVGVAETLPDDMPIIRSVFWRPGDPVPGSVDEIVGQPNGELSVPAAAGA